MERTKYIVCTSDSSEDEGSSNMDTMWDIHDDLDLPSPVSVALPDVSPVQEPSYIHAGSVSVVIKSAERGPCVTSFRTAPSAWFRARRCIDGRGNTSFWQSVCLRLSTHYYVIDKTTTNNNAEISTGPHGNIRTSPSLKASAVRQTMCVYDDNPFPSPGDQDSEETTFLQKT